MSEFWKDKLERAAVSVGSIFICWLSITMILYMPETYNSNPPTAAVVIILTPLLAVIATLAAALAVASWCYPSKEDKLDGKE